MSLSPLLIHYRATVTRRADDLPPIAPGDTLRCAVTSGTPRQPKRAGNAVGIPFRAFAASREMLAGRKPGAELTVAVATELRREERQFNRGGHPP